MSLTLDIEKQEETIDIDSLILKLLLSGAEIDLNKLSVPIIKKIKEISTLSLEVALMTNNIEDVMKAPAALSTITKLVRAHIVCLLHYKDLENLL